jgi:hypothetical protein
MSFFLENYLTIQKSAIKPLHDGFGFGADEIQRRLGKINLEDKESLQEEMEVEKLTSFSSETIAIPIEIEAPPFTSKVPQNPTPSNTQIKPSAKQLREFKEEVKNNQDDKVIPQNYYVHPFFAFLAWTIDSLLGFCFLIISLCANYVFVPKGFFDVSPTLAQYLSMLALDVNVIYTFLFSLQVWFFMAILVFLFQYTILGFEGATLGRWLFGISIQNNKNKVLKVSEKTKICAAISESLLMGGILSFIFIVMSPSRVPIFFWMRYSSKKQ